MTIDKTALQKIASDIHPDVVVVTRQERRVVHAFDDHDRDLNATWAKCDGCVSGTNTIEIGGVSVSATCKTCKGSGAVTVDHLVETYDVIAVTAGNVEHSVEAALTPDAVAWVAEWATKLIPERETVVVTPADVGDVSDVLGKV